VYPLFDNLQNRGIIPWLDRHDYPHGRTSFQALRDGVLHCRHTVFLVTVAMLEQPRGWTIMELAWAVLLQENLRESGGILHTILLPLFFLDPTDVRLPRCAWFPVRDRALFYQENDGDPAVWAARQIEAFVLREALRGHENAMWLLKDSKARERLAERQGLIERITALHPTGLLP